MALWQWIVDGVGVALLVVLLYGLSLVVRRRLIGRDGGTFELSHRVRSGKTGRGWVLGVGRYSGDLLEFFRVFSVSPRPMRSLDRARIEYVGQRAPVGSEAHALYAGHVIVTCRAGTEEFELAMTSDALTGFLSWLEAAPPGQGPRAH